MTPDHRPTLYDDDKIDPFLKYGDLPPISSSAGPEGVVSTAADLFATDRSFHQAIYDGDLWFMHIES